MSALLVTGDAGHVLLDTGLSQSAPLIDANIRKLGFKTEDIKLIVNSHAHYDHLDRWIAGGSGPVPAVGATWGGAGPHITCGPTRSCGPSRRAKTSIWKSR